MSVFKEMAECESRSEHSNPKNHSNIYKKKYVDDKLPFLSYVLR